VNARTVIVPGVPALSRLDFMSVDDIRARAEGAAALGRLPFRLDLH
jgi:hypothetical protein